MFQIIKEQTMHRYQQGKILACLYDPIFDMNTPISMKSQSLTSVAFPSRQLYEKTVNRCSEFEFFFLSKIWFVSRKKIELDNWAIN